MAQAKSTAAKAAAEIRAELRRRGLSARVTSKNFAGGNSVDVEVHADLNPEQRKDIEALCHSYQYGHFDGMTDTYHISNKRDDRPHQAKYVHVQFRFSDECKAAAEAYLETFSGLEEHRRREYLHMILQGSWGEFWENYAPAKAEPVTSDAGYRIEQHTHTKRGFDFHIVVLDERVDRAEFERLRRSCKAAGGWYSRKWQQTPGGFAFKDVDDAKQWAEETFGSPDDWTGREIPGTSHAAGYPE